MIYCFDAGHSVKTKGKVSPDKMFYEWWYNRLIVSKVAKELDKLGIKYIFTYPLEDDDDLSLTARAEAANRIARIYGASNVLFISVHSNAFGTTEWSDPCGWSIYTTKGTTKSDSYADIFWEEAKKVCDRYGRKIRKDTSDGDFDYEENFTVLWKTICPAVLVEQFFYTNKEEKEWLMSDEGKSACTEIIVNAIKRIEGLI